MGIDEILIDSDILYKFKNERKKSMSALILQLLAVILITYGIIVFKGKTFIIPKLIARMYWIVFLWAGFISTSIAEGGTSIILMVISGLFAFIYTIISEKDKYIVSNVNNEQFIKIVRDYLDSKSVKVIQESDVMVLSDKNTVKIKFDYYPSGTLINLKMVSKRKLRGEILRHTKNELKRVKNKKHSFESVLYVLLGLIVMLIFAAKTLKYIEMM